MRLSMFKVFFLTTTMLSVMFSVSSGEEVIANNIDKLISDLRSSDELTRTEAAKGLGKLKNDKAINILIKMADDADEDWNARIAAIRLLAEIGEPKAADPLMRASNDFCPAVRWNAVIALGRFQDSYRVVNSLIDTLNDDHLYIREAAIQSLGEIGNPRAVLPLVSVLGDRDFVVRLNAIKALRKIGDPQAIPFLRETAYNDADPLIKEEALSAIMNLAEERRE